jgi:ParB-like chromosome segregation protein Spo0J
LNIEEHGIKKALVVVNQNGKYEVIDGGRRLECAETLKIKSVPCEIWDMSEDEQWYWAYALNELDQPLDAMSRGWALYTRKKALRLTNEQLGKRYPLRADMNSSKEHSGLSDAYVSDLIKLVVLPEDIQRKVEDGFNVKKATVIGQLAFDIRWNSELNDFNYDAEPEDWKDKRINYQLSLAEKTWTVEDLRKRVKNLIDEEERRRKALELAKMKTQKRIEQMEKDATSKMNKLAKIIEELDEYFAIKWTANKGKKALENTIGKTINEYKAQRPDPEEMMRYNVLFFNTNDLRNKIENEDKEVIFEDGIKCNHCARPITTEEVEEIWAATKETSDELQHKKDDVDKSINSLTNYKKESLRLVSDIEDLEKQLKKLKEEFEGKGEE